MASIRLVFPMPFEPTRTVTPGLKPEIHLGVTAEIGQGQVL